MVWIGRALTFIVVALLLADGAALFLTPPFMIGILEESGFAPHQGPQLAAVTILCAVLLAIPRTAVLGAILVTAFLGGAIAVHFRLGEIGSPPQLICVLLGIAAWAGLYLRDARLRALVPLRSRGDDGAAFERRR
jgi:hypothetical protein